MLLLRVLSPLNSNRETKYSLYAVLVQFVSVEQSVKCSLCDYADPGSILAREEYFLITLLIFIGPTHYQASLILIYNVEKFIPGLV